MYDVLDPSEIIDSETLVKRARQLCGVTLGKLAQELHSPMPANLLKHKGWIGHLLEKALGAKAGSQPQPDFPDLGIELKTIPVSPNATPLETTFVCSISLLNISSESWETSKLREKILRILWIPILTASREEPLAQRRIGPAFLSQLSPELEQQLQNDWLELTELIALGRLEEINGNLGVYLQIRPKGANSKALCLSYDHAGRKRPTLPRGFYLRTAFTKKLLAEHLLC